MKKAGLVAALLTCFTLVFTSPTVNANRSEGIQPNGNVDMSTTRNYDNTIGNDMRQGYQNMKNGMQRATNRAEYDVNRATNRMETGINRTTDRIGNLGNGINNNRYNTMNTTGNGYRATATTNDNRGFDWGWLGLLGLLGLAGMRSRDRERDRA